MTDLAGRYCADHDAPALWQSPWGSRGITGGWFCGATYTPLVEDDQGNLHHPEAQR